MSPSMWLPQSKYEVFDFFQEILQGPQCWSFESRPPSRKRILALANNYKYGVEIWGMCPQLDLEVSCKRPKKRRDHLIFINFGGKEFTIENIPKKTTFMFECYNLLDPKDWGAVIFWGWFTTR
jgi:hypothetical protein